MVDAIVLCGGIGSRLGLNIPKALVRIRELTLIERQVNKLLNCKSIDKIILAVGHRMEEVIGFISYIYKDQIRDNKIVFSIEKTVRGTGGGLKLALKQADSEFVYIINVDDLSDLDIGLMAENKSNTIALSLFRCPFGVVHTLGNDVTGFQEKPILKDTWVNMGHYLLKKEELYKHLPEVGSFEFEVLPKIPLKAYKHKGWWVTINTQKDIENAEKSEFL